MSKRYLKSKFIRTSLFIMVATISFCHQALADINFQLPASYPALYVDFKQERHIQGLQKPIISEGKMIISEKEGLLWNQQSPFEMNMILTPKKMVSQIKGGKKEIITAKDNPQLFQFNHLLSALFTMNTDSIAQYFAITSVQTSSQGETITLKPIISPIDKIFKEITLFINHDIQSVTLIDLQGDTTKIDFSNHDGRTLLKDPDVKIFQ